MFVSKRQRKRIEGFIEEEWFAQAARRKQMREKESHEVRERVIKRLSRDYQVNGFLGCLLFAIAVKFAAKVIEDLLREYFKGETTSERQ